MRVLAIDTATTDLVTGLVDLTTGTTVDRVVADTRAHNEQLIPTVEELLAEAKLTYADLDAIVVGCGPGPFTGLRVGMATASALGVALGIPVHGVCTHDAISQDLDGSWLVATDARRREVYWATYADGARVSGPEVTKPEELEEHVGQFAADAVAIPDALAERLPERLRALNHCERTPRAGGLVAAALAAGLLDRTPEPLVPLYLRRPDAVPPKLAAPSSALTAPAEGTQ